MLYNSKISLYCYLDSIIEKFTNIKTLIDTVSVYAGQEKVFIYAKSGKDVRFSLGLTTRLDTGWQRICRRQLDSSVDYRKTLDDARPNGLC